MTVKLKNIANLYFELWQAGDFTTLRSILSDDIIFIGALGKAQGIDECIKGLQGLANIMTKIDIQHLWVDNLDIITWYEFHTTKTSMPIPVVNWSHVKDNKITQIRVVFDPRPLLD